MAGSDEFATPTGNPTTPERASLLARAYARLPYHAGVLSLSDAAALASADVTPPPYFAPAGEMDVRTVSVSGETVGIVVLPDLPEPGEAVMRAAVSAARGLRETARLVVALSPWGEHAEEALLATADGAFDLVCGSGPGLGFGGRVESGGKTLWVRAYTQGKAVQRIDLLSWPARSPDFVWKDPVNVIFSSVTLGENLPADPSIEAVLSGTDK